MNRFVRTISSIWSQSLAVLRLFCVSAALIGLSFGSVPLYAADVYWDTDGSAAGNMLDGTGLGGTGTWDNGLTSNWWDGLGALLQTWNNANNDTAIFSGPFAGGAPTFNTVTLGGPITAGQLTFQRSGYTLTGSTLDVATINIGYGMSAIISSTLNGTNGLTVTGGGTVRLADGNTYTGATSINNGTVVITSQSGLGAGTGLIDINGSSTRSLGGGSLILDGSAGGINITREIDLSGRGPISDRGTTLLSYGDNELSSSSALQTQVGFTNTRVTSVEGTLTISSDIDNSGGNGDTFFSLGGIGDIGTGNYVISGALSGDGSIEKSGGGMLHWNPSDTSGFSGRIRISGSTFNEGGIWLNDGNNALGTRAGNGSSNTTGAVLDFNSGLLELRMDNPVLTLNGGGTPNVYQRANAIIALDNFSDRTSASDINIATGGTLTLGEWRADDNRDFFIEGRNGYNLTIGAITEIGGNDNDMDIRNRLDGGGLLTINGDIIFSQSNTTQRLRFFDGDNGDTLINGSLVPTGTGVKELRKDGQGTVTILGTNSSNIDLVNIDGGTLAITDFRSLGLDAGATINIDGNASSNSAGVGTLRIGTSTLPGTNASDLTLTNDIVLDGGNGQDAIIQASQAGSLAVVISGGIESTVNGASRDLVLAGSNTLDNIITGDITQSNSDRDIRIWKIGKGTWVLGGGNNAYEGETLIGQGTLKAQANADASTIIPDASNIRFVIHGNRQDPNRDVINETQTRGTSVFEFVGTGVGDSEETVGNLVVDDNANTIRLNPNGGTSASLTFAGITNTGGTARDPEDDATVNFDGVVYGTNDIFITTYTGSTTQTYHAGTYVNGADFALIDFDGAGTGVRAPVYGTDLNFVNADSTLTFTAGSNINVQQDLATSGALAIESLRIDGSTTNTLTLAGILTIQDNGAANNDGGIILTGGDATITGSSITTGGTGGMYIRVDGGANTLTLSSTIPNTTDGGFTKTGEGTLVIDSVLNFGDGNADRQSFLEGTTRLSTTGSIANRTLYLGHDARLELNGSNDAIRGLEGGGVIDNISSDALTFTIGNNNQGGIFNGVVSESGGGQVSVTKIGSAEITLDGASTFTGPLTIGGTGVIDTSLLANIGVASGIGAGDATDTASNAASLVFTGDSAAGNFGRLDYDGWNTVTTDRLFTLAGTGANAGGGILNNGIRGGNTIWSNTNAIAFGDPNINQTLRLGGGGNGDNVFMPRLRDPGADAAGTGILNLFKQGTGNWVLGNATNDYTGTTFIGLGGGTDDGVLVVTPSSLPNASGLQINSGQLAMTGTFTRDLVTVGTPPGAGQLSMDGGAANNNRGFAAAEGDLTVTLSSNALLTWGAGGFIPDGSGLRLNNAQVSFGEVDFTNSIDLGASQRSVFVENNGHTGYDFATLSGDIIGTGGLRVDGGGVLRLTGNNNYTGQTVVRNAELHVSSLGNSTIGGTSSIGDASVANVAGNELVLEGTFNSPPVLVYTGSGEVTDRTILLNGNHSNNNSNTNFRPRIYASGTGALVITDIVNNMFNEDANAGPLRLRDGLILRGNSSAGNMITANLADTTVDGAPLDLFIDGAATWILTGTNTYSGTTHLNSGSAGVGNDDAFGTSTLSLNNGTLFAYGADRTLSNQVIIDNNTTMGYIGEYSVIFTDPTVVKDGNNNWGINSSIVDNPDTVAIEGVYFNDIQANALNVARTFTTGGNGFVSIGSILNTSGQNISLNRNNGGTTLLTGTASEFNAGNFNIDNGTIRLGASGVIPDGAGEVAALIFDPEAGETGTLDLNGFDETINGLTTSGEGNVFFDNTGGTDSTFTFGADNAAISLSGNTVTTTFQDTGAGRLSIVKTGTSAATFDTDVFLNHTGSTGVTGGGSLTIQGDLASTTGLLVDGAGSLLDITGAFSGAGGVTSVAVTDGGTLDLSLNGTGDVLNGLTTLELGTTSGVTLNFDAGDIGTDLLQTAGAATTATNVTLNISDLGLSAGTTYTLVQAASGLSGATFSLGSTPGGFTGFATNFTDTLIQITPTALDAESTFFFTGTTDNTWNGNVNNFSTTPDGLTPATLKPGSGDTVNFVADSVTADPVDTTLEEDFNIAHVVFRNSTTTPAAVSIGTGTGTNILSLTGDGSGDGITVATGGPDAVTISAPLRLLGNQDWEVVDSDDVLTISGPLFGEADVAVNGAGTTNISGVADTTFNAGGTTDFTVTNGTLVLLNTNGLGTSANAANVIVGTGGAFYPDNANVNSDIELAGGTISTDNNDGRVVFGDVTVTADSFWNGSQLNGMAGEEGRNLQVRGTLSGTSGLTISGENDANIDGNLIFDTRSAEGEFIGGTAGFSGTLNITSGIFTYEEPGWAANDNFQTAGAINFTGTETVRGRLSWNRTERHDTLNMVNRDITVANGATNAVGEIHINDADDTTDNGSNISSTVAFDAASTITLGDAAGGTGELQISQSDSVYAGTTNARAQFTFAGGVVLANDGGIAAYDNGTNFGQLVATISGGISETGAGGFDFISGSAIRGSNAILEINSVAASYTGNTILESGHLRIDNPDRINTAGTLDFQGGSIGLSAGGFTIANDILDSATDTDQIWFRGYNDVDFTVSDSFMLNSGRTLRVDGDSIITPLTNRETVTFTGAINADDHTLTLEGNSIVNPSAPPRLSPLGHGIVTGGITQASANVDITVNGGEWTFQTGTVTFGRRLNVNQADAIVNLNSVDVLTAVGGTDDIRVHRGGTLNINFDQSFTGIDRFRIGVDAGDNTDMTGVANLANGITIGNNAMDVALGLQSIRRNGQILVDGFASGNTATILTDNVDLYEGILQANLDWSGTGNNPLDKFGPGSVTLSGDNSAWDTDERTRIIQGGLILDYTVNTGQKISNNATSELEMRGGTLTLNGNATTAVIEDIGANGVGQAQLRLNDADGYNVVTLNNNGADIGLRFGQIVRDVNDGTVLFELPSGTQTATNGIITDQTNGTAGLLRDRTQNSNAAYAVVRDGDSGEINFATNLGGGADGNIGAITTTIKNDVTTWAAGDHVTDSTGYTGTISTALSPGAKDINSLRFDADANSTVDVGSNGALGIQSGGILITDDVTSGTQSITGGTLEGASGGDQEIVIHNYGTNTFEISSRIGGEDAVTISGTGTTRLSGDVTTTGRIKVFGGTLETTGNLNNQLVIFSNGSDATWNLTADESIQRLIGGRQDFEAQIGTVNIGTHTLEINYEGGNNNWAGDFVGTGTIIVRGNSDFQILGEMSNNNIPDVPADGFQGNFVVDGGNLRFDIRADARQAASWTVQNGGLFELDKRGNTREGNAMGDAAPVTLISADGGLNASPHRAIGFGLRTDQDSTNAENIGVMTLDGGHSYVTIDANTAADDPFIQADNVIRNNGSTFTVRGYDLGNVGGGNRVSRLLIDNANEAAFEAANEIGGGGAIGTKNISIVPWAIGSDATTTFFGINGELNPGNSFAHYDAANGFRVLDITAGTGEYDTFALASADSNVRESLAADLDLLTGATTVNSVVIENDEVANLMVTDSTGATDSLAVTSGGFLFNISSNPVSDNAYVTTLDSFENGISVGGSADYIFHVVEPFSPDAASPSNGTVDTTVGSTTVTMDDVTGLAVGMYFHDGGTNIATNAKITAVDTDANTITLNLAALATASNFTAGGNSASTLRAVISSDLITATDLIKSGRGELLLSGANTAVNDVYLNDGTLIIGDNDNIGGDSGAFNFAGGTLNLLNTTYTDDLTMRTITYVDGTTSTLNLDGNALNFAGSLGSGDGNLIISGGSALTLNVAATRTGDTTITGAGTSVVVGATADVFGTADGSGEHGDLTISNGGDLNLGTSDLEVGFFTLGLGGTTGTITGTGTLTSDQGFLIDHNVGSTISALLSGNGGLIKADRNNFLTLNNDSSNFTGPIENRRGTFNYTSIANADGSVSSLGAPTTVENGTIRHAFGGGDAVFRFIGTTNQSSDRVHLLTGTTGGLFLENDATGAGTATLDLGTVTSAEYGAKTLTLRGTSTGASSIESLQGQIGPVNLSKTEAGIWTVRNESAYTGTTTVTAGTLILNGNSLAATAGDTIVADGATLGGSNGAANLFANNATISGNHHGGSTIGSGTDLTGQQTFAGNLDYNGGTPTVTWDLISSSTASPGTNFDQFVVSGDLTFTTSTALNLRFNSTGSTVDWVNDTLWDSDQQWTLYEGTNDLSGQIANLVLGDFLSLQDSAGNFFGPTLGPQGASFALGLADSNTNIVLNFTAVPEPSTFTLMGLGLAAFGWFVRRKRRKVVTAATDEAS